MGDFVIEGKVNVASTASEASLMKSTFGGFPNPQEKQLNRVCLCKMMSDRYIIYTDITDQRNKPNSGCDQSEYQSNRKADQLQRKGVLEDMKEIKESMDKIWKLQRELLLKQLSYHILSFLSEE